MNDDTPLPQRLRASSPGLGAASASEIEIRALELARSDGRNEITERDLDRAAAELDGSGENLTLPEVTQSAMGRLTSWDEPVGSEGRRITENRPEDEGSVAEQLIEDGMREADHDSRVAAADEADERER